MECRRKGFTGSFVICELRGSGTDFQKSLYQFHTGIFIIFKYILFFILWNRTFCLFIFLNLSFIFLFFK